jgi:hypothetical protein
MHDGQDRNQEMEGPLDEPDRTEITNPSTPSKSSVVITWNPFPARKLIAGGALLLVLLWLMITGDQVDAWCVLFATLVMRLLEDYLDIFEARSTIKTGIFESKLKYFVFLNGGVTMVWLIMRVLFPKGMIGAPALLLWIGVLFLSLLSSKPAAEAAARRAIKVERRSENDM